ncbi:conserved hypothetical protein [Thermobifida fusca YX]|nr:conserved hypothetical protein [Thermobifida fusca YX]
MTETVTARRSIPTCVGLTPRRTHEAARGSVHPHVRGAHGHGHGMGGSWCGPSPRAWGSQLASSPSATPNRSIPTCVGLTRCPNARPCATPVHPHVRGAHSVLCSAAWNGRGPSPRAWGSRSRSSRQRPGRRSIPTCVGLTPPSVVVVRALKVHPHVRGAHMTKRPIPSEEIGPSPRAWGSPGGVRYATLVVRSIPTCVGLTRSPPSPSAPPPVHPHVRGAHSRCTSVRVADSGPSPRAWGSLGALFVFAHLRRSIPTCVGLTSSVGAGLGRLVVHPHVRGAHRGNPSVAYRMYGPSPRAWGSRRPL